MVEARGRSGGRREAVVERRARRAEVTDPQVVMDAAASFLAVRPRSVAETRRRLRSLGYSDALVGQVVERFVALGYLDDSAFARAWVESRDRAHPRGSLALRQELARKGVERDVVDAIMADRDDAADVGPMAVGQGLVTAHAGVEDQAAERLLARKSAALSREPNVRRRRQKAYALLARHGFPPDICRRLAASVGEDAVDGFDKGDDGGEDAED